MHLAKVPGAVTDPTTDKIVKSMINFELHGLMDCAVELAEYFRPLLSHRLDPDTAVEKLLHRPPNARNTADVTECLRMIGGLRALRFEQMERFQRSHADAMAEMSLIHAAEREAATARNHGAVSAGCASGGLHCGASGYQTTSALRSYAARLEKDR